MPDATAEIMAIAYQVAGISFSNAKRSMVESRLAKRLRQLDCSLGDYVGRVRSDPRELTAMLDLLTTNHTAWRREPAHFTDLETRVLPKVIAAQRRAAQPRLRIWCAAAATGEEPWTIALSVARAIPDLERWDAAILATDLSTRALERAHAGRYDEARIATLSSADRALAVDQVEPGQYSVTPRLRRMVEFARLNLMGEWPMRGPFDCIFCRNVMIYFDQPTQARLVNRLAALLAPGGTLYVGHSESLSALSHPLRSIGPAAYAA